MTDEQTDETSDATSDATAEVTSGATSEAAAGAGPGRVWLVALLLGTMVATFGVTYVLVTIVEHKQAARTPFVMKVQVDETSTDPVPWGLNWPHQFDGYKQSPVGPDQGGSSALAESKLEAQPWLKRLYAGYAFSIDYREARGHAYMLYDQEVTERVTKRKQSGACLHCHASVTTTYRRIGREALGKPADAEALGASFDWEAVQRGFEELSRKPYHEVHAELLKTPDGTPGESPPLFPGGEGKAHPVSCIDCHDPNNNLKLRVTRPGFVQGIRDLAASDEPVAHMPSIERWRKGDRKTPYDPNALASTQEMRSFVCGQCHVEYYCANKLTLHFPWGQGLKAEQLERIWEALRFSDGSPFFDYTHGETGAPLFKAQHPEFELWSQGLHARAGVSCSDCHMPYERKGAMKVSSHSVQSPLKRTNQACQTCHHADEAELIGRVRQIQARTTQLMDRAAKAMTDMLDAIREAQAAGVEAAKLQELYVLQRKAMWRLDYVSSENSKGFHAPQEAARILGESIDYSRQAQALANRLRAPEPPRPDRPTTPVRGVSTEEGKPAK